MVKIHLDTDIGGDMDDLCALALLLKWQDVEITGITTVAEDNGRRAGFVRHVLDLAGRSEIPVAAGADVADGYYRVAPGYPPDEENWGQKISPLPGKSEDAIALMKRSIDQGAILVAEHMRLEDFTLGGAEEGPRRGTGGKQDDGQRRQQTTHRSFLLMMMRRA